MAAGGHHALDDFTALDPASIALLLDVDGTIIDIGPSPFDVHVPEALCRSLARLFERTAGALALVSGRPIRDLDRLFSPLTLPAIGGHGAELRTTDGQFVAAAGPLPEKLRRQLAAVASGAPGIEIEDKGYSLALHFRRVPAEEARLRQAIERARAAFPDEAIEILPGKAMFEVKRSGVSKGAAVHKLMAMAPFAGRVPVFIGDDVTDESVFAVLPSLRGKGYSVGRKFTGLAGIFAAPGEVREALQRLAG